MTNPKLSIIIPARNEEKNIARCIDSVLIQTFNDYELIVIDDNSNDETFNIVSKYINKNIDLIQLNDKPEEWVGKNYALCRGFERSKGETILFIDADVQLNENCIMESMKIMEEQKIDLLSLAAFQESKGFWVSSLQPLAFLILNLLFPLKKVNDSKNKLSACNGTFIMIKRDSYLKIGTHSAIKDDVLEDLALGRLIKSKGMNLKFIFKPDLLTVRMYSNFIDLFEGWSKNFFAILGFSKSKSLIISFILLFSFWGICFFFLIINNLLLCIIWSMLLFSIITYAYSKMGYKKRLCLLYPIGSIIFPVIILYSLFCYTIKGQVKWKSRYYKVKWLI